MSTPATILTNLKTALSGDVTLGGYVKAFYLGFRNNIVTYPALIIEPVEIEELTYTFGRLRMILRAQIVGIVSVMDEGYQIVGSGSTKGIMDLMNDVKKAIDADRQLSSSAINTEMKSVQFDAELYPLRIFTLNVEILFEQDEGVRT